MTILFSCNPYKQLEQGEYLLNRNTIKIDKPELKEGAKAIIKQKANRKILGIFRFHLGVYTLGNQGRSSKFKNWLKYTVGEEPVVLDTSYTSKSTRQIKQYMQNNGYFDADVSDTTIYKKKKAFVRYTIKSKQPYFISEFKRVSTDSSIHSRINYDTTNTYLVRGKIYSKDDLQKDRERITDNLRNDGYYYFGPQYINYKVLNADTSHYLDIVQEVNPVQVIDKSSKEILKQENHKQYFLQNVYVNSSYNPLLPNEVHPFADTILYEGYYFISPTKEWNIKPSVITRHALLKPNSRYEFRQAERTYRSLNGLGIYKLININFLSAGLDSSKSTVLDAYINLAPHKKQDYKFEVEGTVNGGNYGVAGDISYRNKNLLKGAELFELKLRTALEEQKNFAGTQDNKKIGPFNTFEFDIENSVSLPKAMWPLRKSFKKKTSNPQTIFATNFNIQSRPEFFRRILDFSASLEWRETRFKKHIVTPVQINFINVDLVQEFRDKLIATGDPVLLSSYDNHLITNGRYTYIFNNQEITGRQKDFVFMRFNTEFAGNSLRLIKEMDNGNVCSHGTVQYKLLSQQFAQYIRPDVDFRYYRSLNAHNSIAFRLAGGIGITYLNSRILPFEKSFFAGGSNDLRAYRARTVGPGSYSSDLGYERIGDIKINTNLEYRFDILKILKGAFFIDAGNIWLRQKDALRPGAEFRFDNFLNKMAIGSGIGFRVDFTFFIFRLDVGVPLKDPSLAGDKKYIYKKLQLKDLNYNFGIGYPF